MSDARQNYESMKEALVGFRSGTMPLSDLIDRLPALLKENTDVDPEWREEFVGCWWTLEQIHGEAIDLGESRRLPTGARETVDDAIQGLERLVNRAITSAR